MFNRILGAIFLLILAAPDAFAIECPVTNSTPGFTAGGSVFGRIAAQWNAYFGSKVDANNGILCNPTIIGGQQPGAFTIGPGQTNILGTQNIGNQLIASGATLNKQLFPVKKSASYVVNSDNGAISDSGVLLIATATATFTLPPTGSTTKGVSYHFGSDGIHSYTLNTAGMTALFYGCANLGTGLTSYTFGAGFQATIVDDGTNYNCLGGITSTATEGIPGDGVTDAAPAIEAALNANAAAGAGCVMLPPPAVKYKIGRTIIVPANGCLDGIAGMPTWLQLGNGVNDSMFQTASGAGNITFKNIQLDGNRANNTAGQGILVIGGGGASAFVFDNVWAHDFYQTGLYAQHVSQLYVMGGGYYHNGNNGISLEDGVTEFVTRSQTWLNGIGGVGIGACTKGWISGISWDNGQGQPGTGAIADNFGGYDSANSDLVVGPLLSIGGGNNGVHFGGNRVTYTGVVVKSPTFYGLIHSTTTVYTGGTLSATNGSNTITGTGTLWLNRFPFGGFGVAITIGGNPYIIRSIVNDTTITLKGAGYTGTTGSGLSYVMAGIVESNDVTMTGGHVEGGVGNAAVDMNMVNGGSITGLSDYTGELASSGLGLFGSSNIAVANNNFSNNAAAGVTIDSQVPGYSTGTVTTTSGSPIVTGSGTSFLDNVAQVGSYFLVSGDITAYRVASVDSDTQITLAANYACGFCGAGKSYTTAGGISRDLSFSGGIFNSNAQVGIRVKNTILSSFTGYVAHDNGVYGVQEGGIATDNFYSGSALGNLGAPSSVLAGSAAATNCPAGTFNPATSIVTNGSITHC